ncbi:MAG: TolC family protein [Sulfurimonas sp.]|uniref:TolC family protein n=1 Tax=Sulfurimonas sp. TaxID=2022749 RepID=UPI002632D7AC|nr:TolC family protein [Sulfurimonas sp.]MDD5372510.1 TolC family protein [Sulfurimonas sp.]
MKTLFFLLISVLFLDASTINLDEILQKLKNEHPAAKSIQSLEYAHNSQNKAVSSREALGFLAEGTYAKPALDKSGYEYSVGVEQKFMHPSVKKNTIKSAKYGSEAEILSLKHDFALLENEVRLLYHINCLDQKNISRFKESFLAYEALYMKKEKSYKYGEISKKELLQLQIELERLKNEYKFYENEVKISRDNLQSKILLPFFKDKELSCEDIKPVIKEFDFDSKDETLNEQSLNKKIQSLQSDFDRYNAPFDSFTLGASYQNELDAERFKVALSIPLNFTTSFNEESRAAAMHKKSAAQYEKDGLKLQKTSGVEVLKKELTQSFENINAQKAMVDKYENELMPLVKSAYALGEDSAIEYLLSQRELLRLKEELAVQHKKYYETLFKLHSVLQIKE